MAPKISALKVLDLSYGLTSMVLIACVHVEREEYSFDQVEAIESFALLKQVPPLFLNSCVMLEGMHGFSSQAAHMVNNETFNGTLLPHLQ